MMEVDTHADTLVEVNGNGSPHANGDAESNGAHKEPKFASGLILPPPEIKCECRISHLSYYTCRGLTMCP